MSEESRPPIPAHIKREVRQRCGFGCVFCGLPLYEYDHVVPWAETHEHDADNIVLLCDRHHREKSNQLLTIEQVEAANASPANLQHGWSAPYDLHYNGTDCEASIGSNIHVWPTMHDGLITIPLLIDNTPIVMFRLEDQQLLMTIQLFDEANELLVQVVDNELVFSTDEWDVEFVGKTLTVRSGPRQVFIDITFEPPKRVVITRGRIWRNGIGMTIEPTAIVIGRGNRISGSRATGCPFGIASGDVPTGIGGAIYMGSPRADFSTGSTEHLVLTIGVPSGEVAAEEKLLEDFASFLDEVNADDFGNAS
jgi:hypothetical protein